MTTTFSRSAALLCVTFLLFAYAATASADHSEEEENHSHASTITVTNVTTQPAVVVMPVYTTTTDIARIQKMQELLKALQTLVSLLEHKLEHETQTHDEHNNEDHA